MAIKDRYFPTQEAGEKIFLLIRRHWIVFATLAFFIVIMLLPLVALGIYWVVSPEVFSGQLGNFVVIFASIYTLIIVGLCLYGFVNYYLDVYIITNERLVDIKQNGFFRRGIAEVHLRQVQDVEAKVEGFLGTMLHFGNVYIQTAGERENFILEDVSHPYTVSKRITELHQNQITKQVISKQPTKDVSQPKPEKHENTMSEVDDYRIGDYAPYVSKKTEPEEQKQEYKLRPRQEFSSVEEAPHRDREEVVDKPKYEQPIEEIGFGTDSPDEIVEKKVEKELKEFSEGEEVNLDEYN